MIQIGHNLIPTVKCGIAAQAVLVMDQKAPFAVYADAKTHGEGVIHPHS